MWIFVKQIIMKEFKHDSNVRYLEIINSYNNIKKILEDTLEKLSAEKEAYSIEYKIKDYLNEDNKRIEKYKKEQNCRHINVTEWEYAGHDSRDDFYEKRCKDCGAKILDK